MGTIMSIFSFQTVGYDHPLARLEHAVTQSPESIKIEQFSSASRGKVVAGNFSWRTQAGRVVEFANTSFSYIFPFFKDVQTAFLPAYAEYSEEHVPLLQNQVEELSQFSLEKEDGSFYFCERRQKIRSRPIEEQKLIENLCGAPQPHLRVASTWFVRANEEGIPTFGIALKQAGQESDFIPRWLARLINMDDRDTLAAVGEVSPANIFDGQPTLIVPKKPLLTTRSVDIAFHSALGLACAGVLAATYATSPGGRSVIASIGACAGLFRAYSRYKNPA